MLISMGLLSTSWAASLISADFSVGQGYADGDLAGQNGWALVGTKTNAFNVTDAAGSGYITTLNSGFVGGDTPVSLNVASDNGVDTEWDGSIDFSISRTTNGWSGGSVLEFGLTTTSSALNPGTAGAGDEWDIRIVSQNPGNDDLLQIGIQDGIGGFEMLTALTPAAAGWDGAGGTDLETDNLRVVFNVRKTRNDNVYALTANLINLDTLVSSNGVTAYQTVSDAYDAATLDYFVIHHDGACNFIAGNTVDRFDATINSINMDVTTGVAPVLMAPVAAALGGNGEVGLSWNAVVEAETYDVTRSDAGIGGTYSPVAGGSGLTTNVFTDTSVSNGSEYWYKVTAKATGAADSVSTPVSATPEAIVGNTTILNTTFVNSGAFYNDGDLSGQDRWNAIADSNPNAFEVDIAGSGFAQSNPLFATNGGNDVIYSRFTSNEVGSVWSGTTVFSVSAIADGATKTNVINGVEYIGTTANLSGAEEFFEWGISSDAANTDLFPAQEDDVLWVVRNTAADGMSFGLNMYQYNINVSLALSSEQVGWDPLWENTSSEQPDLETEEMTVNWMIRKSPIANKYNGQVTVTVGTNVYEGIVVYTDYAASQAVDAYAASTVEFGMGHRIPLGQMLNVSVDSISVSHTNASAIPQSIPELTAQAGVTSLTIDLNWSGVGEEESVKIFRSEEYGVEGSEIATLPQGTTSYTDSDATLQDLRGYIYTVKTVYDAGATEVASEQSGAFARATIAPLWYPGDTIDWLSASRNYGGVSHTPVASGIGFSQFTTGSGIDGSVLVAADVAVHNTNLCPLIHVVSQNSAELGLIRGNDGGGGTSPLIRWKYENHSTLFYFENTVGNTGGEFDGVANNPTISFDVGAFNLLKIGSTDPAYVQLAIRNDNQWYVGKTQYLRSQTGSITVLDEEWTPLTLATATDINRMTVTNGIYTVGSALSLTKINAVGYFYDNMTANLDVGNGWNYMKELKVEYGSQPSVYQSWAAGFNLYNEAAASTNDYDADGFDNVTEWGLGGNPNDINNAGITGRRYAEDGNGNFLYIYPRLKSSDRPTYTALESDNLVHTTFWDNEASYTITTGGTWTDFRDEFEMVTNAVPMTAPVNFFQLEVTE